MFVIERIDRKTKRFAGYYSGGSTIITNYLRHAKTFSCDCSAQYFMERQLPMWNTGPKRDYMLRVTVVDQYMASSRNLIRLV